MTRRLALACLACLTAASAAAQDIPMQGLRCEQVSDEHSRCEGYVEVEYPGVKFFADSVDWYRSEGRIVAAGNVTFVNADGRISASRVEYDIETRTGAFHQAAGILARGTPVDHALLGHQDIDVHFYAERIEKTGPRRYVLTNGAVSTCLQPTPRWQVVARSMTLALDDYALARHMALRVKGIPVLYLPILYYPLQDEDRATGFLMPSYGTSTLRGRALSNAFFWAIGRSQDATFVHDWFTRTGHGVGAEYRYVARPGSSGNARVYRLARSAGGSLPEGTSYHVNGSATHTIAPGIVARARADYFTDILSQQLYQQDLYRASQTTRVIEGGISAFRGPFSGSILYQRSESLPDATQSVTHGSTPRISASVAPQRLFATPIYASIAAEYAFLPFRRHEAGVVTLDNSLHRMDLTPTIRMGLSRLSYLSVNTSASYRTTYYSRSAQGPGTTRSEPFVRRYATAGVDIIGPVVERVWETPADGGGGRVRHVVEPVFGIDYTSGFEGSTPLVGDLSDIIVGSSARLTYGLNTRLFVGGGTVDGVRGQARELATISVQQTYYTNPDASLFDTRYMSAQGTGRPLDLSPLAMSFRVSPTPGFDTTARLEYDVAAGRGLQAITAGSSLTLGTTSTQMNYSRRRIQWFLPADDFLSASSSATVLQGRLSGSYALHWDLGRRYIVSQTVGGTYRAQCCGFQVEYQTFHFPPSFGLAISADRRLNLSVTLAGLGTFSNFLGAFGALQ